ncbi:unnamed protein product [Ilex paraguariensis]|uniref:Glycosyl transferase CAP10 domain-containing protein n=1 Tax=Ilex paraguariensis TaxID=185542 RepID=A0ABC8TJS2_9AQUA
MRENTQGIQRFIFYGSGFYRHFTDTIWLPLISWKPPSSTSRLIIFFVIILFGALISTRLLDTTVTSIAGNSPEKSILTTTKTHSYPHKIDEIPKKPRKKIEIPLNCSLGNLRRTCPADYYPSKFHPEDPDSSSTPSTCPDYFRWIYEDLRPWRDTGITREIVESANRTANFRLVIVNGRAYVETFQKSFQSRDVFTLWGILQLLRRYPGKVPDLELMFDCVDWPVIRTKSYRGPNAPAPPPLFRYCGDDATLDIVFPDWSFWGWPEINIKPWGALLEELKEGNKRTKWMDREPYAYWKGNPTVAETRMDLLKCNVSDKEDWGARVYAQDWIRESQQGYKQSDLASQCIHRYKIYIEGSAWSVSEKYILACDSVSLIVKPRYYDFFTRSLMPVHHYWPIRDDDKCRSLKFAVKWGNSHKQKSIAGNSPEKSILTTTKTHSYPHKIDEIPKKPRKKIEIPLNCSLGNLRRTCPADYYPSKFHPEDPDSSSTPSTCPDYFRWIYEDLRPWRDTGITREIVESANRTANFRLVIVNGRAYVETFQKSFQSRDVFTLWGILQLLRRYPGKVPDLELMFDCVDWPVIRTKSYRGPNAPAPPPLFRYCGDDATLDIVFPDWSFWGWPEINIKPWGALLEELKEGNKRTKWMDREPYAYWKGNPTVAETRMDLLKCNVSDKEDWGARVYAQFWKGGFINLDQFRSSVDLGTSRVAKSPSLIDPHTSGLRK